MPHLCFDCRKSLYRSGHWDGRSENPYLIGGGVCSYVGAAGCIAATAAVSQANLALGSSAEVLMFTGAGLGIGSLLVAGSVCIACGIEGCRDAQDPVMPLNPRFLPVSAPQNPLDQIRPPQQNQMNAGELPMTRGRSLSPHHPIQIGPQPNQHQTPMPHFDRPSSPNVFQNPHRMHSLPPPSPPSIPLRAFSQMPPQSPPQSPMGEQRRNSFDSMSPRHINAQTPPQQRPRSLSTPPYNRQFS